MGWGRIVSQSISCLQMTNLQLAKSGFKTPMKARRVDVNLTSRGSMFQRVAAMTENTLLLDPTSWNSLIDKICSMFLLPACVGHALEGFKVNNNNFKLDPEAKFC